MNDDEYYGAKLTICEPVIHVDDTIEDIELDKALRETWCAIYKTISVGFVENQENV
jgi:hypothetical protein